MPARDSRRRYCADISIASCYMDAHKKVFGSRPFVHERWYGLLLALEDDLRDANIPCSEYAMVVTKTLYKWAVEKGFNSIPVRVFCGNWAMGKFMKVMKSSTVRIDTVDDDLYTRLFNSELLIAREYINRNLGDSPVRMRTIVDDIRILVDEVWYSVYEEEKIGRPIDEVLYQLCEEFGVKRANSYNDIINTVRQRTGLWNRRTSSIVTSD